MNNIDFIRYSVKIEYRFYYYLKKKRDNLNFDIIINNKYY